MTNLTDEEIKQWQGLYELVRKYELYNKGNNNSAGAVKYFTEEKIKNNETVESALGKDFAENLISDISGRNFINAYKEADKIMGRTSFLKDDDVYINCKPVDTFGKEITAETNFFKSNNMSNELLDEARQNLQSGELTNNIGFQTIVGVFLIIFLYYVGNYVFIKFPKKIINKE